MTLLLDCRPLATEEVVAPPHRGCRTGQSCRIGDVIVNVNMTDRWKKKKERRTADSRVKSVPNPLPKNSLLCFVAGEGGQSVVMERS